MDWHLVGLSWLAHSAVGGFAFLAAGAAAVRLCRQPADRIRVTELALLGAVVVPWMVLLPGLPRYSVGWLSVEAPPAAVTTAVAGSGLGLPPDRPQVPARTDATNESPAVDRFPVIVSPPPVLGEAHSPTPARWSWPLPLVVVTAYGVVTAGLLAWSLLGLWRLVLLRRSARPAPADVVELLHDIAAPAADRVRLLCSDRIDAPLAFGGLRPVIVVPLSQCGPDARDALRYGLAHEWSHVERGDVWRWHLVAAAQLVLFYQPLFWWLRKHLRLSQDFLADAAAAGQAPDPIDYAEYLVSLARRRLGVPALALGITDRRSLLARRVHVLLENRDLLRRHCRRAWTGGAAVVGLGLLAGLSAVRLDAGDPPANAPKPTTDQGVTGETLSYTGRVTEKGTGEPIPGAAVVVRRSVYGDPTREERDLILEESKHTTDADGKYTFTIPPAQSAERYLYIELDVEHPEFGPRKGFGHALSMIRKNEKLGGRPFFERVELRPGKPVTGVVQTEDGKPAVGVKVLAYSVTKPRNPDVYDGSFIDTRTDDRGRFRLPLTSPGWAVIWILPEEFVPTTHVLKDRRGDLGTFTLRPGPRLRGTVLDTEGMPLAGVIVNAETQLHNPDITEPVADQIRRSAVANDRGEFEMKPLPQGIYLVRPDEYAWDGSLDRQRRPVPAVFGGRLVQLQEGADPMPVEVRAVPHATIEARHYDGQGKPTRGHAPRVAGRLMGAHWSAEAAIDPTGKATVRVPRGLENVTVFLSTNEHGTLRWRKAAGEPLNNSQQIKLGKVIEDVTGIEIVRYTAPILLVKVTAADGAKLTAPGVTATYPAGKKPFDPALHRAGGRESDVSFEKQEDGRFRSEQMLPDEDVTVTAYAEGYAGEPRTVTLAEGSTQEIELVLEQAAAKVGEGKKK